MPELPEVETIVRGLRPNLMGRTVTAVEVLHEDLLAEPAKSFRTRIQGQTFTEAGRRGKNVILTMESARTRSVRFLVVNLGMSGGLLHRTRAGHADGPSHPGVTWTLDDGSTLVYQDVRRFGRLRILAPPEFQVWSDTLGPEPLSEQFTIRSLAEALSASRAPIRSWLLDQKRVAGIGNIYANEALFVAGIHPKTPARCLSPRAVEQLHLATVDILREAIREGGTTLRDYRTAAGERGSYTGHLRVYGKEREKCPSCEASIVRVVFGGRSAFFCPRCQNQG